PRGHPVRALLGHGPRPPLGPGGAGVPRHGVRRGAPHRRPRRGGGAGVRDGGDGRVPQPARPGRRVGRARGPDPRRRRGHLLQLPRGPRAPALPRPGRPPLRGVRPRPRGAPGGAGHHDPVRRGVPARHRLSAAAAGRQAERRAGGARPGLVPHGGNGEVPARHLLLQRGRGRPARGRAAAPGAVAQGGHLRPAAGDERAGRGAGAGGGHPVEAVRRARLQLRQPGHGGAHGGDGGGGEGGGGGGRGAGAGAGRLPRDGHHPAGDRRPRQLRADVGPHHQRPAHRPHHQPRGHRPGGARGPPHHRGAARRRPLRRGPHHPGHHRRAAARRHDGPGPAGL
ncbi:MAG: 2,3-bisphosphoglycerate-independent phosphoglycerate mutase, partial [uncultured Gemmatimonadetes bacterium]